MEIPLLKDILIIFALAIAVLLVCHRLQVPSIVGFLLTGLLAGPHMLGFVSDVHTVEALAESGVILLLFSEARGQASFVALTIACRIPELLT